MDNWKKEQKKFETGLQSSKAQAIKNNLEEMYDIFLLCFLILKLTYVLFFRTGSIKELIQKVNTYKTEMGLNWNTKGSFPNQQINRFKYFNMLRVFYFLINSNKFSTYLEMFQRQVIKELNQNGRALNFL